MFDRRANTYDDSSMHRWLAQRAISGLAIPPQSIVLDAAAGTGLVSRILIADHPAHRCIAVDLSAGLLRTAKRYGLHAVQGDVERLPIRTGAVDWVVCVSAIAYFPQPTVALAEFGRVLRSGGSLVVQVWAADGLAPTRILRAAAAAFGIDIHDPNAALGSSSLITAALAEAQLSDIQVRVDTWRQPWSEADEAWSALLASPVASGLPSPLRPVVRKEFEVRWAMARSKSPDYDAQPVIIATATKS